MREIIRLEEWMTPIELNESADLEILNEGKLINAIRWKIAKFSLRFLQESTIDSFLKAYYTDKTGRVDPKGLELIKQPKKEKVKKIRELANTLKDEDKQKIVNSQAAKQCEKQALSSGIYTGAILGIGVAGRMITSPADQHAQDLNNIANNNANLDSNVKNTLTIIAGFLARLASEFITVMSGSLILVGIGALGIGSALLKANSVRRDDIVRELLNSKKALKEDFEFISIGALLNEFYY